MSYQRSIVFHWMVLAIGCAAFYGTAHGDERVPPVAPSLEIEVLDPGVDPLGNPAVLLEPDPLNPGQLNVEIPPVVLVHRYYYSGDRTFRGPNLPGGPSIIVAFHPHTGEQCYVQAQMLPGSPEVTYRDNYIDYNYGDHGIRIEFGRFFGPRVEYRNGASISDQLGDLFEASGVAEQTQRIYEGTSEVLQSAGGHGADAVARARVMGEMALVPVQNVMRFIPGGNAFLSRAPSEPPGSFAQQYNEEREREQAIRNSLENEITRPTTR